MPWCRVQYSAVAVLETDAALARCRKRIGAMRVVIDEGSMARFAVITPDARGFEAQRHELGLDLEWVGHGMRLLGVAQAFDLVDQFVHELVIVRSNGVHA